MNLPIELNTGKYLNLRTQFTFQNTEQFFRKRSIQAVPLEELFSSPYLLRHHYLYSAGNVRTQVQQFQREHNSKFITLMMHQNNGLYQTRKYDYIIIRGLHIFDHGRFKDLLLIQLVDNCVVKKYLFIVFSTQTSYQAWISHLHQQRIAPIHNHCILQGEAWRDT